MHEADIILQIIGGVIIALGSILSIIKELKQLINKFENARKTKARKLTPGQQKRGK